MLKKQWFICILLISFCAPACWAQYRMDTTSKKGFDKEKLFFGGNLGLSFGDITYFNLSPLIGYRFSNLVAAGVQINGQYESVQYRNINNSVSKKEQYGVVGLGVFGRVYPIPQIFLQIQPEMNFIMGKVKHLDTSPPTEEKYHDQVLSMLGGAGYSQSISPNSSFVIMVLYDILQDDHSPYGNKPIFRAGVNIGF